jgi:cation-transporting P-type ATPase 13A2
MSGNNFEKLIKARDSGQNIHQYTASQVLETVVRWGKVYSRMSPQQKGNLIKEIQNTTGEMVGMWGDGANDCDALNTADLGLSLSKSEASIAAPFTSSVPDITSVVNLLKLGRSSLDLSYLIFKYMIIYSAMEFTSVIILYYHTSNISDSQLVYIDLFWVAPITLYLWSLEESNELKKKLPPKSLLSPSILFSLIGQPLILGLSVFSIYMTLRGQGFFEPNEKSGDIEEGK